MAQLTTNLMWYKILCEADFKYFNFINVLITYLLQLFGYL